jgi:hypothetical protein
MLSLSNATDSGKPISMFVSTRHDSVLKIIESWVDSAVIDQNNTNANSFSKFSLQALTLAKKK